MCVCERATWIKSAQQTNEETHERREEAQGRKGTESDSVSLRKSVAEAVAVPESKQKAQRRRAAAAAAASTSASAQRFFLFWCVCVCVKAKVKVNNSMCCKLNLNCCAKAPLRRDHTNRTNSLTLSLFHSLSFWKVQQEAKQMCSSNNKKALKLLNIEWRFRQKSMWNIKR